VTDLGFSTGRVEFGCLAKPWWSSEGGGPDRLGLNLQLENDTEQYCCSDIQVAHSFAHILKFSQAAGGGVVTQSVFTP